MDLNWNLFVIFTTVSLLAWIVFTHGALKAKIGGWADFAVQGVVMSAIFAVLPLMALMTTWTGGRYDYDMAVLVTLGATMAPLALLLAPLYIYSRRRQQMYRQAEAAARAAEEAASQEVVDQANEYIRRFG